MKPYESKRMSEHIVYSTGMSQRHNIKNEQIIHLDGCMLKQSLTILKNSKSHTSKLSGRSGSGPSLLTKISR